MPESEKTLSQNLAQQRRFSLTKNWHYTVGAWCLSQSPQPLSITTSAYNRNFDKQLACNLSGNTRLDSYDPDWIQIFNLPTDSYTTCFGVCAAACHQIGASTQREISLWSFGIIESYGYDNDL